ncbi:ABC transporter permease [Streptomyces sp. NRRL F-4474]|uniref:ABC transporter permease n=1 Tax=Streptomyces sp. NRRL F-4474 TaxID=1463851 RepID=UPI0004CBC3A1|nr:ABC transporter permease [Streptomyces sp. NRRL F-4474]
MNRNTPHGPLTLVGLVAWREIVTQFQRKELWASLVMMILVFCGALGLQKVFTGAADRPVLAVVGEHRDLTESLRAQTAGASGDGGARGVEVVSYENEAAAEAAVRAEKADAALVGEGRVLVREKLPEPLAGPLYEAHRTAQTTERLRDGGLTDAAIARALAVQPLTVSALDPDADRRTERTMTAAIGVMALFFLTFMFGQGIAQGVLEEKSSRIVEVLLAKVHAWQLLAGKVLGIGLVAFVQISAMAAGGVTVAVAADLVDAPADAIGTSVSVVLWFIPGFLGFAALWAVAGALASRAEDLQHAAGPVSMLQTLSLMAALAPFTGISDTLTRLFSLVPGLSSAVMPVRMASENVPWWEVALAAVLLLASIAALLRVGGRIYIGGLLQHGGIVKARTALRNARLGGMS